jgi:hypothetical protein
MTARGAGVLGGFTTPGLACDRQLRMPPPTTQQKALEINLDPTQYGTFAEIGAGQEVARWFFRVGGAAGTIADGVSAYDKQVSDARYGSCKRYVSRERLRAMLDHEYGRLGEKLSARRGDETRFFAFADTVATAGHSRPGQGDAWLGMRFQRQPAQSRRISCCTRGCSTANPPASRVRSGFSASRPCRSGEGILNVRDRGVSFRRKGRLSPICLPRLPPHRLLHPARSERVAPAGLDTHAVQHRHGLLPGAARCDEFAH